MMRRDTLRRLGDWLTSPTGVAIALGLLGLLVGAGGYANQYCYSDFCNSLPELGEGWAWFIKDFYGNTATTLIGIAIAVFTIERANERRAEQQLRAQLIREMGSSDNGIALRAVSELRAYGWLRVLNGINLQGANLQGVNLQGVNLSGTNLQGANLYSANLNRAYVRRATLEGADLREANLSNATLETANLKGANLSNATLERANLKGANLSNATLERANLYFAILSQAVLETVTPFFDFLSIED